MDGGRCCGRFLASGAITRAQRRRRATIGQGIALLFGFVGLFTNPFLVFIALFVWIGATQEATMVKVRSALGGVPVEKAMLTDFKTVSPDDPLRRLIELTMSGSQQDYPVTDGSGIVGIVTHRDLIKGLFEHATTRAAGAIMRREFQVLDPGEMLEAAFMRIQSSDLMTVPVVRNGRLVGLLTMDNVGEFMRIQAAMSEKSGLGPGSDKDFCVFFSALRLSVKIKRR
ncbi:MAG: CBS domain-containing protein [Thermodesulfobacteriota bacterium]